MPPLEKMQPLFRRYGVRKAALFGSMARSQNKADSDMDLIVSFGLKYDLLDLIGLKQDLEDVLSIPVDIVTYESLKSDAFARNVLREERVIYEHN